VKLEWENPTGSVKDRMAHTVISRAEADGRLQPGDTVVEYTGGSTGASLALVCAARDYRLHIVSSDAFSPEKLDQPEDRYVSPHPRVLDTIPLFASMDDDERTALATIMDEVAFPAGHTIYRAEEVGGTLYILLSGEVEMSIEDDQGKKVVIDTLRPGEFCGELSLLDGGNRSATVTTTQPTRTLVLKREHLVDLLMRRPHMAQDMMMWLVKRIRRTDGLLRRRVSRDPNEVIEERETLGTRVADKVASFGGSWTFISLFAAVMVVWVLVNTILLGEKPFDAYPSFCSTCFCRCWPPFKRRSS
jgi:CRP-like cAMP-binding protein